MENWNAQNSLTCITDSLCPSVDICSIWDQKYWHTNNKFNLTVQFRKDLLYYDLYKTGLILLIGSVSPPWHGMNKCRLLMDALHFTSSLRFTLILSTYKNTRSITVEEYESLIPPSSLIPYPLSRRNLLVDVFIFIIHIQGMDCSWMRS